PDARGRGSPHPLRALGEVVGRRAGGGPERRARGDPGRFRGGGAGGRRLRRALRPQCAATRRGRRPAVGGRARDGMLDILALPLLACLVLTGIHVYLGLHVLARGVIFVDLALAEVAVPGITVAYLAGHPIQSPAAYWYALAFAVGSAALFAMSRTRSAAIPQEALIGIVYVVSAATAVLVVDRAPQGSEHIKQLLVGNILTVTPGEVGAIAALYAVGGAGHWIFRRPLLEISLAPEGARARGRRIAAWDLAFYVSFALVVTSSVRMAGVLLVFSYLIVPAALGARCARSITGRLRRGRAGATL